MVGFLEHVSLVMDADSEGATDAVNIMTLHSAKGLEFDTVFLPGWEEGLFPSQRTLDENGRAGLEEERRLAYVGITRARKRAYIRFAANRRMHGLWQSGIPSRFLDELPEAHVDVIEDAQRLRRLRLGRLRRLALRRLATRSPTRPTRRPAGSAPSATRASAERRCDGGRARSASAASTIRWRRARG